MLSFLRDKKQAPNHEVAIARVLHDVIESYSLDNGDVICLNKLIIDIQVLKDLLKESGKTSYDYCGHRVTLYSDLLTVKLLPSWCN